MKKLLVTAFSCLLGFYLGYLCANYHWFSSYMNEMSRISGASSVDYSLIYMEMHTEGNVEGAHAWVKKHALSDPEWNVRNYTSMENWAESFTNLLFNSGQPMLKTDGLEVTGRTYVDEIRSRQKLLKQKLDSSGDGIEKL